MIITKEIFYGRPIVLSQLRPIDRCFVYERFAKMEGITPVDIELVYPDYLRAIGGKHTVEGCVVWKDDHYQFYLRNDLSTHREVNTFAHELAHAALGHVPRVELSRSQMITEGAKVARNIDSQDAAHQAREAAADALGEEMLKRWEKQGLRR